MRDVRWEPIDQALDMVYRRTLQIGAWLSPQLVVRQSRDDLRGSDLGLKLVYLQAVGDGTVPIDRETVLATVDGVLDAFFRTVRGDVPQAPRSFWDTSLGLLIGTARFRAWDPADLLPIPVAADALGTTRPAIYRLLDDRTLEGVRDPAGKQLVTRRSVERLAEGC